jgi:predicted GIY-YIG superfamily endonuclease
MEKPMRFVYVLKNRESKPRFYVGRTSDLVGRLVTHNAGGCPHTAKHRPWQIHVVIEFPDEPRAARFERYLKSGSGRAFAKRHFEP